MHATALASSHLLIARAIESYGLDSEALFRSAGLDPAGLSDPEARYPEADSTRLLELALAASGDPCFGLRIAQFWHPGALHALGFAWLASASLREALERLVRYFRMLIVGERLELEALGQEHRLIVRTPAEYPRGPDVLYDMVLAAVLHMCRISRGADFDPRRLTLRREAPPCAGQFQELFRCPVEFEAELDTLHFDTRVLEAPLPTANRELAVAHDRIIAAYLADLDRSAIAPRVKARLVDMLPSGAVSEQAVADVLHLSLRSLQRRLKEEGTSYKALLDETRRDLAVEYVRGARLSVSEIAYLLGFSEPGNFSRAFRRWTGNSPSGFREHAGA